MERKSKENLLQAYKEHLSNLELASNTIGLYIRDIKQFLDHSEGTGDTKDEAIKYKAFISSTEANGGKGYNVASINSKLISINKYLKWLNKEEAIVKTIRTPNRTLDGSLTETDFNRIRRQAESKGTPKDVLILDIFYYTGLRVSELQYFTVEACKRGYMTVNNKGRIRKVPITKKLAKQGVKYSNENGIDQGSIILGRNNKPISRNTVFSRLKYLGGQARVKKSKVFPHAIRHLFAKQWIKANGNNPLGLADIMGHSSLETTRIYTRMNIEELRDTISF